MQSLMNKTAVDYFGTVFYREVEEGYFICTEVREQSPDASGVKERADKFADESRVMHEIKRF